MHSVLTTAANGNPAQKPIMPNFAKPKLPVVSLAIWVTFVTVHLVIMGQAAAQSVTPAPTPTIHNAGVGSSDISPDFSNLSQDAFLQMLVARNLDVEFSRVNTDINRHLRDAEAALYEPVFYMNLRKEGRNRQRSSDERSQSNPLTALLNEKFRTDEFGVRNKMPTGGDVSLSYRKSSRLNNLIPIINGGAFNNERSDLLNLTLKQPLLKNAGRSVTETDRRVAELEHQVSLQQLTQQTLKTSIEGLNLYWQLYKAQETVKLRKNASATTDSLMKDTRARIAAGKTPASAVLELQSAVVSRQAELLRSQQALNEAQSKFATTINLKWENTYALGAAPRFMTDANQSVPTATPLVSDLLGQWSPYQISLLRQAQAQERQRFAKNQVLSTVDLVLNYGGTGLSRNILEARDLATKFTYPDWYIGLNVEIPLDGNQKAKEQLAAQNARVQQSELERQAIENSFNNDMVLRLADLQNAVSVLDLSKKEVKLREKIFQNEGQRMQAGSGLLSVLLQKQVDFIEAAQKLLDNQVRYEIALNMWQYTRGTLLADNGITISDDRAP